MGRLQWDAEGHRALLEAALGVRLFEARNGRLPRTPAELVPAALPAIPVDPWTGRPVAIELSAEGWAVEAGPPAGKHDFGDGSSEERNALRLEGKASGR
jgi:hypothetical protein